MSNVPAVLRLHPLVVGFDKHLLRVSSAHVVVMVRQLGMKPTGRQTKDRYNDTLRTSALVASRIETQVDQQSQLQRQKRHMYRSHLPTPPQPWRRSVRHRISARISILLIWQQLLDTCT
jgi:hypothetical protein